MSAEKGSIRMKARIIFLALFLATCLAVSVWAQEPDDPGVYGGFYGLITYDGCTCHFDDWVCIRPTTGNCDPHQFHVRCAGGNTGYTTDPINFVTGWYYISVVLHEGGDCDHSLVQFVQHGYSDQEVNLVVKGPDGGIGK
jgi:hypothetical protein